MIKYIRYNSIEMRVDRDTTYADVKTFVALSYGYMNWDEVWKDTSAAGNAVFTTALIMVDKLRAIDWND